MATDTMAGRVKYCPILFNVDFPEGSRVNDGYMAWATSSPALVVYCDEDAGIFDKWRIGHVPSGYYVWESEPGTTREYAMAVAEHLATAGDWAEIGESPTGEDVPDWCKAAIAHDAML